MESTRHAALAAGAAAHASPPTAAAQVNAQRIAAMRGAGLKSLLHSAFGFSSFRPNQEAVCRAVIEGRDVLLVMPTGSGKSLCYQLPGIARGGTALVISPLIALMEDQAAKLKERGFIVDRIHSGRSRLPRSISGCGSSVGSLKKTLAAAEQARPDVAARRAGWLEDLAAERTACLVFVDESGANTKMTRLRGRALGGERLRAHIPPGRYQTSTLISGIRREGPCAPWLFEGPMDGEMFWAWARQGFAPALRPGDVVILDNLATHKIRESVKSSKPPAPG